MKKEGLGLGVDPRFSEALVGEIGKRGTEMCGGGWTLATVSLIRLVLLLAMLVTPTLLTLAPSSDFARHWFPRPVHCRPRTPYDIVMFLTQIPFVQFSFSGNVLTSLAVFTSGFVCFPNVWEMSRGRTSHRHWPRLQVVDRWRDISGTGDYVTF